MESLVLADYVGYKMHSPGTFALYLVREGLPKKQVLETQNPSEIDQYIRDNFPPSGRFEIASVEKSRPLSKGMRRVLELWPTKRSA